MWTPRSGGVWHTIQATLPNVLGARGYILHVLSMGGVLRSPFNAPSAGAKAAVQAFANTLRLEVRNRGAGAIFFGLIGHSDRHRRSEASPDRPDHPGPAAANHSTTTHRGGGPSDRRRDPEPQAGCGLPQDLRPSGPSGRLLPADVGEAAQAAYGAVGKASLGRRAGSLVSRTTSSWPGADAHRIHSRGQSSWTGDSCAVGGR